MADRRRKRLASVLEAPACRGNCTGGEVPGSRRSKRKSKQPEAYFPCEKISSRKGRRSRSRKSKGRQSGARKQNPQQESLCGVSCNDYLFKTGGYAYVVLNSLEFSKVEEDNEPCVECLQTSPELGPMIECDQCLAGYHFHCLSPSITELPECDWVCPVCEKGGVHPPRRPTTYRELFLQTDDILTVCEVAKVVQKGNTWEFAGRRCIRPEATHCGRQSFHGAREIFQLDFCEDYEIERLVRPVNVMSREEFKNAPANDDNFFVEFTYDYDTQKFHQLRDKEAILEISTSEEDSSAEYDPKQEAEHDISQLGKFPLRGLVERQGGGKDAIHEKLKTEILSSSNKDCMLENDTYKLASHALSLTAIPKSLSCRDKEKKKIADFINSFAKTGYDVTSNNCLYICGVPGTGKTATVLETLKKYQSSSRAKEKSLFNCAEINCFRLPSPHHLYSHLLRSLTGEWLGSTTAHRKLLQIFSSNNESINTKRLPVLLVADELDAIVTKDQKVLYNLSEWCSSKHSKLAMIGIANTIDLPERLHPKIKSRMGHQRICFNPYSRDQIIFIVRDRLNGLPLVFDELSVKMAAAKVAGINGDVRRALELLRVAIDVYKDDEDPEKGSSVKARHIQVAVSRIFQSPINQMLHNASPLEKIILVAFVQHGARNLEITAGEIASKVITLLANAMMPTVSTATILARISSMGDRRLLECEKSHHRTWQRVALNLDHDDIINAVKDEESLGWLKGIIGIRL